MSLESSHPVKTPFVNYLDDQPALADLFDSKAHARTAQAIFKLITWKSSSTKTIALTGSWGSGKSSIIELVKQRLKPEKNYEVFVFNAWSHDKEPIRTAFLEELILFLLSRGWLKDEKSWQDSIDELSGKLKKSRKLEKYGYILLVCGYAIALGSKLLSLEAISPDKLNYSIKFPPDAYAVVNFWIPISLILLPVAIILIQQYNSIHSKSSSRWIKEYVSTEATSREFQNAFKALLEGVLKIGFEKRLVIVIDNLDRLEPEGVKEYWALISTFFDISGFAFQKPAIKYRDVFWLLVPYDPIGLKQKFHIGSNTDSNFFRSFTEKTFQITYKVPYPLSDDWQNYMLNLLSKAFPEETQETLYEVYSAYQYKKQNDFKGSKESISFVTPRAITLFINQLGAFYQQSIEGVALQYCAIYLLYEEDVLASIKFPQDRTLDEKLSVFSLRNYDWKSKLFALHFNVQPEKAFSIVMSDYIQENLFAGEYGPITEYKEIPAFFETIKTIISHASAGWLTNGSPDIGHTAFAIAGLNLSENFKLEKLYRDLYSIAVQTPDINRITPNSVHGLLILIKQCELEGEHDYRSYQPLTDKLLNTLASANNIADQGNDHWQITGTKINPIESRRWLDCVFKFLGFMDRYMPKVIEGQFFINMDAVNYINLLKVAISPERMSDFFDEDLLLYFRPSAMTNIEEVRERIINQRVYKQYPFLIKIYAGISRKSNFDKNSWGLSRIFTELQRLLIEQNQEYIYVLEALLVLSLHDSELEGMFKALSEDTIFFSAYSSLANDPEGRALVLYTILMYNPNIVHTLKPHVFEVESRANTGLNNLKRWFQNGDFSNTYLALAKLIVKYKLYQFVEKLPYSDALALILATDDDSHVTTFFDLLDYVVIPTSISSVFSLEEVIEHFGERLIRLGTLKQEEVMERFLKYLLPQISSNPGEKVKSWLQELVWTDEQLKSYPQLAIFG